MTDNNDKQTRGWVFYDAQCAFCRAAARWRGPFERRGYRWLPLDDPSARERTGLTEDDMRVEMKLARADGAVVGGADAVLVLMCAVWWLSPFAILLGAPGIHGITRAGYRWIARNRSCIGGACALPHRPRKIHRTISFLEWP